MYEVNKLPINMWTTEHYAAA